MPYQYQDDYRLRVLDLVNSKVEGKEVTAVGPEVQRAQVIDLMDALKQSLAKRAASGDDAPPQRSPPRKFKPPRSNCVRRVTRARYANFAAIVDRYSSIVAERRSAMRS